VTAFVISGIAVITFLVLTMVALNMAAKR